MTDQVTREKDLDYYMALSYPVVLTDETDDEGTYCLARMPDLPGCMSHGDSPEEAIANIQDAKRAWLAVALADGDPIPEPAPEEFSGKFIVRGPRTLHKQLTERAKRQGVSLNQFVVSELSRALGTRD